MAMTVDKFALLVIFFNGSFFLNCCHVEKMTQIIIVIQIIINVGLPRPRLWWAGLTTA